MAEPHKGEAYTFPPIALTDFLDPSKFTTAPIIIDDGDFRITKDHGALANLATKPTNEPAGSPYIKISLSAVEMNADKIGILGISQQNRWKDISLPLDVPDGNAEKATELLLGDMEVTKTRSITRKAGTATIIRDKDVSGSRLSVNDTIRTTEHI